MFLQVRVFHNLLLIYWVSHHITTISAQTTDAKGENYPRQFGGGKSFADAKGQRSNSWISKNYIKTGNNQAPKTKKTKKENN